MLTQERVKELFDYREDGVLVRRVTVCYCARFGDLAGSLHCDGYLQVTIDGLSSLAHRIIWLWHKGYLPEHGLDHIDRNKLNNRIENLREVGHQCNMRNTGNGKNNSSGVKGVCWDKTNGKWLVQITINRKTIKLGCFSDFTEAVAHRLAAEQAENWQGCDSSSPAYQYISAYVLHDRWYICRHGAGTSSKKTVHPERL